MAITRVRVALACVLAVVLCLCVGSMARADESEPIMGTTGSTQMTLEVLDQPDYDLEPQSEPKAGAGASSATTAPSNTAEPIYPDMPQTGVGAAGAVLVAWACGLGALAGGLEGWR